MNNASKSTKRLLLVLARVAAVGVYITFFQGSGSEPVPVPAASSAKQEAASDGVAGNLPADPTGEQRPGQLPAQQLPAVLPGTKPVILVYNPFQIAPAQ